MTYDETTDTGGVWAFLGLSPARLRFRACSSAAITWPTAGSRRLRGGVCWAARCTDSTASLSPLRRATPS
jgi:hypothetical protein